MSVPKLKRDETRTKIINKLEVIKYIKYYMEDSTLVNYKDALINQSKVDYNEVKDIIDEIDKRIDFFKEYNKIKVYSLTLKEFYKNNLDYFNECFHELFKTNNVSLSIENMLTNFLNYVVTNEENGIQNDLEMQNIFNDYKNKFDNKEFVPKLYFFNKIKDIMERKDKILNKVDDNANDYVEIEVNDESTVGGYVLTTIILESSIAIILAIILITLFR